MSSAKVGRSARVVGNNLALPRIISVPSFAAACERVKSDAEYFFPPNFTCGDDRAASIIGDEEDKRGKESKARKCAQKRVAAGAFHG